MGLVHKVILVMYLLLPDLWILNSHPEDCLVVIISVHHINIMKPLHYQEITDSGAVLIRFEEASDMFWYDDPANNSYGISIGAARGDSAEAARIVRYMESRAIMTPTKTNILTKAHKELTFDTDFKDLIYAT
jgi:hypothetical protein